MANATREGMWHHNLLYFLYNSFPQAKLFCDNKLALHIAANQIFHKRAKHIEMGCHFVCEHLLLGIITICYTPTIEQIINIFTKALG